MPSEGNKGKKKPQNGHSQLATAGRVLRSTSANEAASFPSAGPPLPATSHPGCQRRLIKALTLNPSSTEQSRRMQKTHQPGTSNLFCPQQAWSIHLANVLRNIRSSFPSFSLSSEDSRALGVSGYDFHCEESENVTCFFSFTLQRETGQISQRKKSNIRHCRINLILS